MSNDLITQSGQQPYVFANAQTFETAQRIATALSSSDLVPKEYKKNLPNCLIALEIAQRTGSSPLLVMQNLYIVHGKPSWSSQFIIAAINSCGRFKPVRFDLFGDEDSDGRTCIAWTVERDVNMPPNIRTLAEAKAGNLPVLESPPVSIKISKAEGWFAKSGSKWQTMPELMLRYRSATFFGRLYAPDILMGMQTVEEVQDVGSIRDVTPASSILDNLNSAIKAEEISPANDAEPQAKAEVVSSETGEVTPPSLPDTLDAIKASNTNEELDFRLSAALADFEADDKAKATIAHAAGLRRKALPKPAKEEAA